MLPNRMQLKSQTEEQLKRIKAYTGLTPNIVARLAFFRSVESGFILMLDNDENKLDGNLILDKITWLGETMAVTELVIKMLYPNISSRDAHKVWAAHVEDGIASIRNHRNIKDFLNNI